jgi:hypothetical protein
MRLKKGDRVRPYGKFVYGIVQQVSGSTCRVKWDEGTRVEFCGSLELCPVDGYIPTRPPEIIVQESLF